jgi:hypothetical protein
MVRARNRWALPAVGVALAYGGYLLLSVAVERAAVGRGTGVERWVAALLPLVPLLVVIVLFAAMFRRLDEVERMVHLIAFTVGFTIMLLAALVVARLESVGLVTAAGGWVWASGVTGWLAGLLIAGARYR